MQNAVSSPRDGADSPRGSADTTTAIDPNDPAIGKLFAVLLAGEYAAFDRLLAESATAPNVAGRIAIARLTAAEIGHFDALAEQVSARGLDPVTEVERYRSVFDKYHRVTTPKTWYETLVKAYVGDGLAADFYTELSGVLPESVHSVIAEVMSATGNSQFARAEVLDAVNRDPALRSPLTLWGRRLLGEAITHTQWVLAAEDQVADLLFANASSLSGMSGFFDTVAARHATRMSDLGLG